MTDILWIDLETRSWCNLITRGGYNYSQDPSTEILIACFALDNGPVERWLPWKKQPMPAKLAKALANPKVQVRAHGNFERLLLKIPLSRYYDVAAQMRSLAIPGGLDAAARFLKLKEQKDPRGAELIRLLSIPRKDGSFCEDPFLMEEFADYCATDVIVMRQLSLGTQQLDEQTLALYRAGEEINDRGIPVDLELARLAVSYAEQAQAEAQAEVARLTGGEVRSVKSTKLTGWVYARVPPEARQLMLVERKTTVGDTGGGRSTANPTGGTMDRNRDGERYASPSLDRATRESLIAMAGANPDGWLEDVVEVIEARESASPASVGKYEALLNLASDDGRLRGSFILNGAGQTGRFSAWGCQVHNLPRACAPDPETVLKVMRRHGDLAPFGTTLAVLKSMLRPAIFPGVNRRIIRTDWNAVEARCLPWLADCPEAEKYLDAFRDPSRDVYTEVALATGLGENRQAGKVLVLSLGYGGSVGALSRIAAGQGVTFTLALPTVVARWRAANAWAVQFWSALDRAARQALIVPGSVRKAGRVSFEFISEPNYSALTMLLPSGRRLFYPFAALEDDEHGPVITYAKSAWRPKAHKEGEEPKPWPRARLWGGLLCENACQATCADLLREVILARAPDVIAHLHDEVVSEATNARAKSCTREQERRMLTLPRWAAGFPLKVESDISERFRK